MGEPMNAKDKDKKVKGMVEGIWNAAVDNEDGDCDECKYFSCVLENHGMPGGMYERLCECQVPDAKDCPVVEEIVSALYQYVVVVEKTT